MAAIDMPSTTPRRACGTIEHEAARSGHESAVVSNAQKSFPAGEPAIGSSAGIAEDRARCDADDRTEHPRFEVRRALKLPLCLAWPARPPEGRRPQT